ncbi:hypothetical protein AKJ48_03810 [candidate division MSBL1 archaeon SCGC-AAA261O19]|uniref:Beta-ribofuranosylaminobenzene 5'-phosphate synthase n=2 Tax=candidate division MSBL1 TaxID=215777 RepID=A0A133V185_9EURY|nr:hypothetical protein AKJ42_01535 [candidate division MSBL1 archaeon SCGC-AAA261C02]KXB03523.1 hypothetical protein AKJ48_03810 [candidate division MSBL1 archaeon SCGC-AAA261O19]
MIGRIGGVNIRIRISSPSRLHLGDIDPFGLGRFGYAILVGIEFPRTVIEVKESDSIEIEFEKSRNWSGVEENEREEIRRYAERTLNNLGAPGAKISVISHPPRHYGLGSTTQLSLSVGLGIFLAYGKKASHSKIMKILKRTSAGGIHTFERGGFVVSGGFEFPRKRFRISNQEKPVFPPLILRKEFPEEWRFVVAWHRKAPPGPSGEEEENAFEDLQDLEPPKELIHEAHFLINTKLVPAVLEKNPVKFGEALTRVQTLVGELYSPVQTGTYNPASAPLLEQLSECEESLGFGQSSWGPAVYSLARDENAATKIIKETLKTTNAEIHAVGADNKGRQIEILES